MELVIHQTPDAVASRAADIVCEQLKAKPDAVLGLATGSTPVALYQELIRRHRAGEVSFKDVTTFNLDEYVGLGGDHPRSYRYFMNETLFDHIDIDPARTHVPRGDSANPVDEARRYEQSIVEAGGIDLQILGIGRDGHIAFNEPTSSLGSRTRLKTLTEATMKDNARFFGAEETAPRVAITMGIATIMEARRILLLATGTAKAGAVAKMAEGPVSAMCPASALQWHEKTSVIVDEAASGSLLLKSYYTWVLRLQDQIAEEFGDHRI